MTKKDLIFECIRLVGPHTTSEAIGTPHARELCCELAKRFNRGTQLPQAILCVLEQLQAHTYFGHKSLKHYFHCSLKYKGNALTRERAEKHLNAGRWLYFRGYRFDELPTSAAQILIRLEKLDIVNAGEILEVLPLMIQKHQAWQEDSKIRPELNQQLAQDLINLALERAIFDGRGQIRDKSR